MSRRMTQQPETSFAVSNELSQRVLPVAGHAAAAPGSAADLLAIQRTYGNRFVQRLLNNSVLRISQEQSAADQSEQSETPPIVSEVLASHGEPLDSATREFMEPRFGHDFSQVRLHTGARAAQSAREINSLAYTVGHDIVFAEGQFSPGTET